MKNIVAGIIGLGVMILMFLIIGVFFFALQYAAQAGWSSIFIRIPFSFGNWLIPAFLLTVVLFFITNFIHEHWLAMSLVNWTQLKKPLDRQNMALSE